MNNPLANDLDHVLFFTENLWEELRGRRMFITGGTGFYGCWILESFIWANDRLGLNASAVVLTRDIDKIRKKLPHLANHPALNFHLGDVRSFDFPQGDFSHIIHAATDASTNPPKMADPSLLFDTIVRGTQHTLEFARKSGAKKVLFTSSGAVYGKQPAEITQLSEEYLGAPDALDIHSVYGEGKRTAEMLCTIYSKRYGLDVKIARGFSFVGPYLPLDCFSVISNFIRDGLNNVPIEVKGDGSAYRSHLYAADLAIWLWTILFKGQSCRAYNVGSEVEKNIAELANLVVEVIKKPLEIKISKQIIPGQPIERYVPSVERALKELNLKQRINLPEAIHRTFLWHSQN